LYKFIDIVFEWGRFYKQESSNFWANLLTSLLGALIGSETAFTVFYLQYRSERSRNLKIKNENFTNTLKYYVSLIKNIIEFADKQANNYLVHSKNLKEKPLDLNILKMKVAGDLNRIVNKSNHEGTFYAFISKVGNSDENIKNFKDTFSMLDYLYEAYNLAFKAQENYLKEQEKNLRRYKDLTEEETLNYCAIILNKIKNTNTEYKKDPFFIALNSAVVKYYANPPKPITLVYMQQSFIEPLKITMYKDFKNIDEGMLILDNCRKATWLYIEIINNSNSTVDDFEGYYEGFNSAIKELKKQITILHNIL